MQVLKKISLYFATFIIVVHTIIPHQHKVQVAHIVHECLFSADNEDNNTGLIQKLQDIVKHVNLGEKHLENFRVSSYEYKFIPIDYFEVPEILPLLQHNIRNTKKTSHNFYYASLYKLKEPDINLGLRAPPIL